MISITRRFEWDAAHRVLGHEGKCKHLHGHRYIADVTVVGPELDSLGRVIDFSVLKGRIGDYIDLFWDHNTMLNRADPMLKLPYGSGLFDEKSPYVMEPFGFPRDGRSTPHLNINPTAENIAEALAGTAVWLLRDLPLTVLHVRVYETPNSWADWSPFVS